MSNIGNTAGTSGVISASAMQMLLAGGPNITLSQSINGGSATVSVSGAAPGGGATISYYENMWPGVLNNTVTMIATGSSHYVQPFLMPQAISVGYVRFPVSMSRVSTTYSTATGSWTHSNGNTNTIYAAVYTQGTGANSLSFSTIGSTSATWDLRVSVSGSSRNHSISYLFRYPVSNGTSSTMLTSQGTSTTVTVAPAGTSNWQSYRYLDVNWPTSFSAANYWMGIKRVSSTAVANIGMNISFLAVTQHNSSIGSINEASNSSIGLFLGIGSVSTNNTTAIPVAFAVSNISTVASHLRGPYFQMIRQA